MAGVEIMDINVSREVNRMTVSIDLDADFQAQLEEIDNELNKFKIVEGRTEVRLDSMQALGVEGLG